MSYFLPQARFSAQIARTSSPVATTRYILRNPGNKITMRSPESRPPVLATLTMRGFYPPGSGRGEVECRNAL